jgi:hypothetical protein
MLNRAVEVAKFNVLSRRLSGGTAENRGEAQARQSLGGDVGTGEIWFLTETDTVP